MCSKILKILKHNILLKMDTKITFIKFRVQVSNLETAKCLLDRSLILQMEVTSKILAEILTLVKTNSLHLHKARWSEVTT